MTREERILFESLQEQNEFQRKLIVNLNANINTLVATLNDQKKLIEELNEKLSKNSHNSSKPPSSDGLKKPKTKSLRSSSGKKPGGQDGHIGTNLRAPVKADNVITHLPAKCMKCQFSEKCIKQVGCVSDRRYVYDIIIKTEVTEHQKIYMNACAIEGGMSEGTFPGYIGAHVQYGENISAFMVALNTAGLSCDHIHGIIGRVFGIPLSTGTVVNKVQRCADKITGILKEIQERIIQSSVVHFDETGTRVEGKTQWVHSASTERFTYLTLNEKRGKDGMDANGVLPRMKNGTAVHDCWKPYWKFDGVRHALCNVHLLRELNGVIENYPEQKWAQDFRKLLLEMRMQKENYRAAGSTCMRHDCFDYFSGLYDSIIDKALKQNPLPPKTGKRGKPFKGTVLSLICRLKVYKDSVCLFATDFAVPFSNNAAEQSVRNVKVKTKNAGCFRSEKGAVSYLKITSYIDSARKNGHNAYEVLRHVFLGNPTFAFLGAE